MQPDIVERLSCMTTLTTRTETPHMLIILFMTLITGRRQINLALHRRAMTGVAMALFMGTIQFKVRLFIMIKPPDLPVILVVAQATIGAQAFLMHIVLVMTTITL